MCNAKQLTIRLLHYIYVYIYMYDTQVARRPPGATYFHWVDSDFAEADCARHFPASGIRSRAQSSPWQQGCLS